MIASVMLLCVQSWNHYGWSMLWLFDSKVCDSRPCETVFTSYVMITCLDFVQVKVDILYGVCILLIMKLSQTLTSCWLMHIPLGAFVKVYYLDT